ncbi:MAG TPA: pantetheine-phosphate adenylyltransferase [Phycisphaerae bacterium]|nr:pantetheine-phosphate adenylyltransferase [Phycisphaerae bacterium]
MGRYKKVIAVFPGAFDPITYGHLDIIERGRKFFDHLIVAVGQNPAKEEIFTQDERVEMIKPLMSGFRNVSVEAYVGLTYDFVKRNKANVILRGIRDMVDLRGELHQANTNLLVGNVETLFMLTSHDHALTSSTLIKEIVSLGGFGSWRKANLVPPAVAAALNRKLGAKVRSARDGAADS